MSGRASDATRAGPGPLEVSFTFQPGNGRNNGCRHNGSGPECRAGEYTSHIETDGPGDTVRGAGPAGRRAGLCGPGAPRLRDPGEDHADHEHAPPGARHSGSAAVPAAHAPGPRSDLREGRPSHRRRPTLAPPAQDVGHARRRTLTLQYPDGNHHKGTAGPAQVRLQGSGCSPGSPHLSWRLRKYVPRHTSSNAASSRATLNRLRETHRTSGSLHPFCRTLRT